MSKNPIKRILKGTNQILKNNVNFNHQYEILTKFSDQELNSFIPKLFLKDDLGTVYYKTDDNGESIEIESIDTVSLLKNGSFSQVNEKNIHNYLAAGLIEKHCHESQDQNNKVISNLVINAILSPKDKEEYEKNLSDDDLYEKDFFFYFNYVSNEKNRRVQSTSNILVDTLLGQFNTQTFFSDKTVKLKSYFTFTIIEFSIRTLIV